MEEEIKSEFSRNGFSLYPDEEEDILRKCFSYAVNYKMSASELVSSWEVYYLNMQIDGSIVRDSHMDGFLLFLQNEQKDNIKEEQQQQPYLHTYYSNDVDMLLTEEENKVDTEEVIQVHANHGEVDIAYGLVSPNSATTKTPRTDDKSSKKSVDSHMTPFGLRRSRFTKQFEFNPKEGQERKDELDYAASEDDLIIRRVQPIQRCPLQVQGSQPVTGCRFMYDRIEDRFTSLESRIVKFSNELLASGNYTEFNDATVASQNTLFAVGMICCDGDGRLNESSVLLQCSVEYSSGRRVRLDLFKLDQYSIFPGQVVGVTGYNPSGHCFTASKMVDSFPLLKSPEVEYPPTKRLELDPDADEPMIEPPVRGELSMIIAAGPFCTSDNLLFEPLTELLSYVKRNPAHLLLMGPFIDSEHPQVKKGIIDQTFDELFEEQVLAKLKEYCEDVGADARVILAPSPRDAHHDFVFPQPALEIHLPDPNNQITCIANPGVFSANEVKISCCTVDVLKHLSGEEVSRLPKEVASSDRLARLAMHMLNQRSFYPLYPPLASLPLDLSLAPESMQIHLIPDLLVLPSDLTPFVRVLSLGEPEDAVKCLCVNPGRLAKGINGGTFLSIKYHPAGPDSSSVSIIKI